MKQFLKRHRSVEPQHQPVRRFLEANETSDCSNANCSSYNFGFPLKHCVRVCSFIGMVSSLLYIIAGTCLITYISQMENVGFSTYSMQQTLAATARHIYYRRNVGFFISIAIILVILNVIQMLSDLMLFLSTFRTKNYSSLWVYMVVDITLWIMILICFITIFSGGGLFLLLVFLLGTAVRAYITFMLHEYMVEEAKNPVDDPEKSMDRVSTITPLPFPTYEDNVPSPIPEESTPVEFYPEMEELDISKKQTTKNDKD